MSESIEPSEQVDAPGNEPKWSPSNIVPGTFVFLRGDFYSMGTKFLQSCYPFGLAFVAGTWWHGTIEETWLPLDELTLRKRIYTWSAQQWFRGRGKDSEVHIPLGESVTRNMLHVLEAHCALRLEDRQLGVALSDGHLDIETGEVAPFQLSQFVTHTLPFSSQDLRHETPERWLDFLKAGFREEDIQLLREWAGYMLEDGNHYQKALWLYGDPGCGKSIIVKVLMELIGGAHYTAVRKASDFASEFSGDLVGKRLIYFQDFRTAGARDHAALNFVLTVSGDDPVKIRRLYKEAYTLKVPAKIVFSSNEMPAFKDVTSAALRRLLVLHRAPRAGAADPGLEAALLLELPQILGWALGGLKQLRARKGFDSALLDRRLMGYVARQTNAVGAWCLDRLTFGGVELATRKSELFASWVAYADQFKHHQSFTGESIMAPLFQAARAQGAKLTTDKSGNWLLGVALKQDDQNEGPIR